MKALSTIWFISFSESGVLPFISAVILEVQTRFLRLASMISKKDGPFGVFTHIHVGGAKACCEIDRFSIPISYIRSCLSLHH